jgi:hypothetical protein
MSPLPVEEAEAVLLPDFLIIGAPRCGTTMLLNQLRSHPDICMPGGEPHFWDQHPYDWDEHYAKRLLRYSKFFTKGKINGEKTPRILCDPMAIIRLATYVPDAKIIVLLRDPVKRYISHHAWYRRRFKEPTILAEKFWHIHGGIDARLRGCYTPQLQHLFDHFDRSQIHITISESMRADPQCCIRRIQKFIGVDPIPLGNEPGRDRVAEEYSLFDRLVEYYKPKNDALHDLLGFKPPWVC